MEPTTSKTAVTAASSQSCAGCPRQKFTWSSCSRPRSLTVFTHRSPPALVSLRWMLRAATAGAWRSFTKSYLTSRWSPTNSTARTASAFRWWRAVNASTWWLVTSRRATPPPSRLSPRQLSTGPEMRSSSSQEIST